MLAAVGFCLILFCTEGDYRVLLCCGARRNYSCDKCEYHTDRYENHCALPGENCADIIKSCEILDDRGDREAEDNSCDYSYCSCTESDYQGLCIEYA